MGAGASSAQDRLHLVDVMPKCSDYENVFAEFDSGDGIDLPAFMDGMKVKGFATAAEELKTVFNRFKIFQQKKGDVLVSEEEFCRFCLVEATCCEAEVGVEEKLKKYENMHSLMGPIEAAHGYSTALAVLAHNPKLASVPWYPPDTTEACCESLIEQFPKVDAEVYLPRPEPVSGWPPLHLLLVTNSATAQAEAFPLVQALLNAYPEAARIRVQQELSLVEGYLPVFFAIKYGWSEEVVKAIIKRYPDAVKTLTLKMKKKIPKKKSMKNSTWARAIAEEMEAPAKILALLPKPIKAKKKELGPNAGPDINDGFRWEMVTDD